MKPKSAEIGKFRTIENGVFFFGGIKEKLFPLFGRGNYEFYLYLFLKFRNGRFECWAGFLVYETIRQLLYGVELLRIEFLRIENRKIKYYWRTIKRNRTQQNPIERRSHSFSFYLYWISLLSLSLSFPFKWRAPSKTLCGLWCVCVLFPLLLCVELSKRTNFAIGRYCICWGHLFR